MSVIKFKPLNWFGNEYRDYLPANRFRQDIDRLFDNFMESSKVQSFSPKIDIIEYDDNYKLVAEIPGIARDNISLEITKNNLVISGKKEHIYENNKANIYHGECFYGEFKRSFSLPDNINIDRVEAEFKAGILEITIPKDVAKAAKKMIDIK